MDKFKRTIEVEDERKWQGPGLNEEGLYDRMQREGFTPEDVRTGKMELRKAKGQEADYPNVVANQLEEYERRVKESMEKDPILAQYRADYKSEKWTPEMKAKISWEKIVSRLKAREGHYLKLAQGMQGGGILWGVDEEGNPLFADRGEEPVMKGLHYNEVFEELYGKNYPDKKEDVEAYMKAHIGYEMFDNSKRDIKNLEKFTGKPFVASQDMSEEVSSWLFSGKNPAWANVANFLPADGYADSQGVRDTLLSVPSRGVRRKLTVKELAA